MSTTDLATLAALKCRIGRPFRYELDDAGRCVGLDLASDEELYHGLIRHRSDADKQEVLELVCRLTDLKRLNLRRNKVRTLPAAFRQLTGLEWLNLGSNRLGRVPDELRYCRRLKYLHLGNNGLTDVAEFLGGLQDLEYLALHKNVRVKSVDALEGLLNLRHLNLHYINLHELPSFIYRFKHLVTLTLWNVRRFSDELAGLQNLKFFSDCGCVGMKRLPGALTALKNLRMVRLFQNSLEELPADFGRLENLEQLSLYQNQLHELPGSFAHLTRLRKLNLGWNRFKFIPPVLSQCRSLEWLGMFENPLKHSNQNPALPSGTFVQRAWPFTTVGGESAS